MTDSTAPHPRRSTAIIALTGGIASGKSTVAARLRARGALVVDADVVSREVTAPNEPALGAIARSFGDGVLHADGTLNREALGAIVFSDPNKRRQLEMITHPAIMARTGRHLAEAQRAGWAWVVYEAALILETRGQAGFTALAVVICPPELQHARLMARNGVTADEATRRIEAQTDNATRRAAADFLIENTTDLDHLNARADALFEELSGRWGAVPPAP